MRKVYDAPIGDNSVKQLSLLKLKGYTHIKYPYISNSYFGEFKENIDNDVVSLKYSSTSKTYKFLSKGLHLELKYNTVDINKIAPLDFNRNIQKMVNNGFTHSVCHSSKRVLSLDCFKTKKSYYIKNCLNSDNYELGVRRRNLNAAKGISTKRKFRTLNTEF